MAYSLVSMDTENYIIQEKEITNIEDVRAALSYYCYRSSDIAYYKDIDAIFIKDNYEYDSDSRMKYYIYSLVSYHFYRYNKPAPLLFRIANAVKEFLNTHPEKERTVNFYIKCSGDDIRDKVFTDEIETQDWQQTNNPSLEELKEQFLKTHPEIVKKVKDRQKAKDILTTALDKEAIEKYKDYIEGE